MRHFLIIILFFALSSCATKNGQPEISIKYSSFLPDTLTLHFDQTKFAAIIDSLDKQHLDSYEELLVSKDFRNIFEHSNDYINNVIKYLADSLKTTNGKTIAIMAMQQKGYFKNLNLLYACDHLFKENLIDEQILFNVLLPRLDLTNADIIKNYKNEQVQAVLNDLKNNSRTTIKFKNAINDILSGKTYKEQKDFLANQYNINI